MGWGFYAGRLIGIGDIVMEDRFGVLVEMGRDLAPMLSS